MEVILSLVTILISAAGTMLAPAAGAVHSESVNHRGANYDVAYQALVSGQMRTVGAATGARPSGQRCLVTAKVTVERSIAKPGSAESMTALIPGEHVLTRNLAGSCVGRADEAQKLAASQADSVRAHLAQVAAADRSQTLSAIDSAHGVVSN